MNRMKIFVGILMLVSVFATAEDKANITSTPHVSVATENQILRAEHTHDLAVTAQTNAQMSLTQLQAQYEAYLKKFTDAKTQADAEEKKGAVAVNDAIANAWKEAGLDKTNYDFDAADFTFKPKAKTTAPATPVVKK
jgi:hypothetical protein